MRDSLKIIVVTFETTNLVKKVILSIEFPKGKWVLSLLISPK